jgi:NADPH:quinone reductase-like Zn-dependent oxidoreductase
MQLREGDFPELFTGGSVPGWCAAGIIDQLGSEVHGLNVGDEVVVLAPLDTITGTHAEYTVQPAINVCKSSYHTKHDALCALVSKLWCFLSLLPLIDLICPTL